MATEKYFTGIKRQHLSDPSGTPLSPAEIEVVEAHIAEIAKILDHHKIDELSFNGGGGVKQKGKFISLD